MERIGANIPVGLLVASTGLTVLEANHVFTATWGLSRESPLSRPVLDILQSDSLEHELRAVLDSGAPRVGLVVSIRRADDGAPKPARISLSRLDAEHSHQEPRLLIAVEDLTEIERLARIARAAERRFDEIVETSTDGIVLMTRDGLISTFNRAAEAMFGWVRDDVVGRPLTMLLSERFRQPHIEGLQQHLEAGQAHVLGTVHTLEGLRNDGTTFPVECTISAHGSERDMMFTAVLRDVTERKAAEDALRRSETSFRTLIEHSPDSVVVFRHGQFVYVNPALLKYLGYERPEELLGKSVLTTVHPEDRATAVARTDTMLASGMPPPAYEERHLRRDGTVVTAELASLPIEFDGAPAIIAVARDVTDRKQLAAKMMQMDRMIAVGTLAAGVGHEINNPLSYVVANLELAVRALPDLISDVRVLQDDADRWEPTRGPNSAASLALRLSEFEHILRDAREGAERVRNVVRDLKTFSRSDEDTTSVVSLRAVAESAINMAWNEIRHRARLVKDYAPEASTVANESRLGQVILNLLVNAAQAIPEGRQQSNEIRVRTFCTALEVVFEVRDTGEGIKPENLTRIFDPFFTTKPVGLGTGLGLSICQGIVRTLGGEIRVQSEVGRGSTFTVALPAFRPDAGFTPRATGRASDDGPENDGMRRGRILIVDDEPFVGTALRRVLARDHDPIVVSTAREALQLLRAGDCFDVIFSDLMMPDLTGMDLYEEIALSFPSHAPRVVFMSGGVFTPRARAFLDTVTNQRLEKPFEPQSVRALVRAMVR